MRKNIAKNQMDSYQCTQSGSPKHTKYFIIIIITNSLMMIPSISLVNAVRNVLCGNEMNGILEFLKVVLESLAIVLGVVLSIYLFGGQMIQWQKV